MCLVLGHRGNPPVPRCAVHRRDGSSGHVVPSEAVGIIAHIEGREALAEHAPAELVTFEREFHRADPSAVVALEWNETISVRVWASITAGSTSVHSATCISGPNRSTAMPRPASTPPHWTRSPTAGGGSPALRSIQLT